MWKLSIRAEALFSPLPSISQLQQQADTKLSGDHGETRGWAEEADHPGRQAGGVAKMGVIRGKHREASHEFWGRNKNCSPPRTLITLAMPLSEKRGFYCCTSAICCPTLLRQYHWHTLYLGFAQLAPREHHTLPPTLNTPLEYTAFRLLVCLRTPSNIWGVPAPFPFLSLFPPTIPAFLPFPIAFILSLLSCFLICKLQPFLPPLSGSSVLLKLVGILGNAVSSHRVRVVWFVCTSNYNLHILSDHTKRT